MLDFTTGIILGIIGGVAVVVFFYSQRATTLAHQWAEKIAQERFALMQTSLEQNIKQAYDARFDQWKLSELAETVRLARKDAVQQSRVTLKGKIGEQLAPIMPEFLAKFEPADARFIGSPIDYVIFKNLAKVEGDPHSTEQIEIFIIDVKTGEAVLTHAERLVKEAVERKAVQFLTMRLQEVEMPRETEQSDSASK